MDIYRLFNHEYLNGEQIEIITYAVDKIRKETGIAIDDKAFFAIPYSKDILLYRIGKHYEVLTKIAEIYVNTIEVEGKGLEKYRKTILVKFKDEEYTVLKNPSHKLLVEAFQIF